MDYRWNSINSSGLILDIDKFAYEHGELSPFQTQGIITCIPKDGRDRRLLKNWRPISLLNVDYKIISGAIANRVKQVLPDIISNTHIISNTQTGFMKGRFIGENKRLVYDIMNYCQLHKLPDLLLMIDFEKAFDTIVGIY
jgi:hypothetical protein